MFTITVPARGGGAGKAHPNAGSRGGPLPGRAAPGRSPRPPGGARAVRPCPRPGRRRLRGARPAAPPPPPSAAGAPEGAPGPLLPAPDGRGGTRSLPQAEGSSGSLKAGRGDEGRCCWRAGWLPAADGVWEARRWPWPWPWPLPELSMLNTLRVQLRHWQRSGAFSAGRWLKYSQFRTEGAKFHPLKQNVSWAKS